MSMNWIERKANREEILQRNYERTWDHFRIAFKDTVKSFERRYGNTKAIHVQLDEVRAKHMYLAIDPPEIGPSRAPRIAIEVQCEFANPDYLVAASYSGPGGEPPFADRIFTIDILPDETVSLTDGGRPISLDEATRLILEPAFFPATKKKAALA